MRRFHLHTLAALCGLLFAFAGTARAEILTVTNAADSGAGSLRGIIDSAAAGDTILFDNSLDGSVIFLTSGHLAIDKDLRIAGLGANKLAITASFGSRIYDIADSVSVGILGMTLAQGSATGSGLDGCGGGVRNAGTLLLDDIKLLGCLADSLGGGIYNSGVLTLSEAVLKSCSAIDGGGLWASGDFGIVNSKVEDNTVTGAGGGIYVQSGDALVTTCGIQRNSAVQGGGIYNGSPDFSLSKSTINSNDASDGAGMYNASTALLSRATLNDNTASQSGGAIYGNATGSTSMENITISSNSAGAAGGGIYNRKDLIVRSSTMVLNSAAVSGGAIELDLASSLVIIENNIISFNSVDSVAGDVNNMQKIFSSKYNIYGVLDGSSFTPGVGDTVGVDPLLGALLNNGGGTKTHALACGSAAIDAGNPVSGLTLDQRGEIRPFGSRIDIGAFELQDSCIVILICAVDSVTIGAQSACDPGTNSYTQDLTVYYSNAPDSGDVVVNGQAFAVATSPQVVTLSGLDSDSDTVDVSVSFSEDTACTFLLVDAFVAPAACPPPVCSVDSVTIGAQSACDPGTNSYTQDLTVYYSNAPDSGDVVVNGQAFAVATSPQVVTLSGLDSDSDTVDVSVSFSEDTACTFLLVDAFVAPAACPPPVCSVDSVTIGAQSACDPGTNSYTQDLTVYYSNAPDSGDVVVNGQAFAVATSPQVVTLSGLDSDSDTVDVSVSFSEDTACTFLLVDAFVAPAACPPPAVCSIDSVLLGTQTACDTIGNTYSQQVIVYFSNRPATGLLTVNNRSVPIGVSPRTVTLPGLNSNGLAVDVSVSFSDDTACNFFAPALFTAPTICINCDTDPPTGLSSTFDAFNNAILSWNPVNASIACRLLGRVLGAPNFGQKVVSGYEASTAIVGNSILIPGASYEWQVRCTCTPAPTPTTSTSFSLFDTFTVPTLREAAFESEGAVMTLMPNPVVDQMRVLLSNLPAGDAELRIYDMSGRILNNQAIKIHEDGVLQQELDATGLAPGGYLLELRHSEGATQAWFVKSDR